ncbi:flagellar basal body rod protein [Gottfriedia acidiceleris]|uniref:Flagellar basal body rod protein n=1 Tax=Gottfriedia acidiceleris TaxID=371036 RepID=A0ABY4JPM2_9BACI|nr:flagellar basal body rod protein [Gottfriedia acidiceleris]UPM55797.1 flagellar basal body rod protein [Gottfriedia acidiceleris]
MKKFLTFILVLILIGVALSNLGGLITLALGLVITYFSFKKFIKTDSILMKIIWTIIGLIGLSIAISGLPSLIGAAAAILLYYLYKDYKNQKKLKDDEFNIYDENFNPIK